MLIAFLFLHENICCGYSLEAPRWGASNEYPQHMFSWRNKKNIMWLPPLICRYGDNERFCAMKHHTDMTWILPLAGFKLRTSWSNVWSTNRLATQMLHTHIWNSMHISIATDKALFSSKKCWYLSYFWTKTCVEALLISTHNICFCSEIGKISCEYPLLSVAMHLDGLKIAYPI